jgi:hypothetical protein
MAEQTKKNTQGGTSSSGPAGGAGASAKSARSTTTPVEQRFDPMTGREIGGIGGEDKSLIRQVRSSASDAYETATTKATEKLEEKKSDLSSGLSNVASSIRQLSGNLGTSGTNDQISRLTSEFSNTAAEKIERVANYFEQQDLNAMYRDAERFARNNPAWVLGGAFALGFLAARFLKSSPPNRSNAAVAGSTFDNLPQQRPQMGGQASRGL